MHFFATLALLMNESGFLKIPRSLLQSTTWIEARPKHKVIFLTIIEYCAFQKTEHNIRGKIVEILPGQLCITFRRLHEICGNGISKNDIEGAIKYFLTSQKIRQEVRHGKMILTIIDSEIYDTCFNRDQTTSQTKVRQKSDIKEEPKKERPPSKPSSSRKGVGGGRAKAQGKGLSQEEEEVLKNCLESSLQEKLNLSEATITRLLLRYGATSFKSAFKEIFEFKQSGAAVRSFPGLLTSKLENEYGVNTSR